MASASPHNDVVERSTIGNAIFWILNGILLLIVAINMILSIYAAIKTTDKKIVLDAICSITSAILLSLFVMDIYNHNVFYTIKQYMLSMFS
ncbi:MAG: hypothetical protein NC204_00235 [Candidatus Amulumruptor caecigallinarius]|nr:hypothetical protein [Candidatus Amulumruptor caecigallinarius]